MQETRLWDAREGRTSAMRSKEEAHDYRYFPEPDLPPLVVDAARVGAIRRAMPELPAALRARLRSEYGVPGADVLLLTHRPGLSAYFEETVRAGADATAAKNWLLGVVQAKMNEEGFDDAHLRARMPPERLAGLIALVDRGTISGSMAKDVFEKMCASGRSAGEIVAAEGLTQIDDEAQIVALIAEVVATHAEPVAQYRGGKTAAFGFLVGQVMKAAAGKANPKRVNELLRRALES